MAELLAETGVDNTEPLITAAARAEALAADDSPAVPFEPLSLDILPTPHDGPETGELTDHEHTELQVCEAAIDNLRKAFWAAGKALQVVRDGRLYRMAYPTFEDYCADRWDMSRRQADRLIAAWPVAERLRPIGLTATESQVRELLPVADRYGTDAAVTVYETVAGIVQEDGGRVTAAVLGEVVRILPADRFDPADAVVQIRAYLAGAGQEPAAAAPVDPVQAWAAERERLRTTVRRAVMRPAVRSVLRERPEEARTLAAELRELAAEIEQEAAAE